MVYYLIVRYDFQSVVVVTQEHWMTVMMMKLLQAEQNSALKSQWLVPGIDEFYCWMKGQLWLNHEQVHG